MFIPQSQVPRVIGWPARGGAPSRSPKTANGRCRRPARRARRARRARKKIDGSRVPGNPPRHTLFIWCAFEKLVPSCPSTAAAGTWHSEIGYKKAFSFSIRVAGREIEPRHTDTHAMTVPRRGGRRHRARGGPNQAFSLRSKSCVASAQPAFRAAWTGVSPASSVACSLAPF